MGEDMHGKIEERGEMKYSLAFGTVIVIGRGVE